MLWYCFDAALVESLVVDQYETSENPNNLLLFRICQNFLSSYFLFTAAQTAFSTPSYSLVFHVVKTCSGVVLRNKYFTVDIEKYFTVDIDHSMDITKPQNPFDINFYDETLTSLKFSKIIFSASQGKRVAWFIQLIPWSSFDGYLIGRKHSLVSYRRMLKTMHIMSQCHVS